MIARLRRWNQAVDDWLYHPELGKPYVRFWPAFLLFFAGPLVIAEIVVNGIFYLLGR